MWLYVAVAVAVTLSIAALVLSLVKNNLKTSGAAAVDGVVTQKGVTLISADRGQSFLVRSTHVATDPNNKKITLSVPASEKVDVKVSVPYHFMYQQQPGPAPPLTKYIRQAEPGKTYTFVNYPAQLQPFVKTAGTPGKITVVVENHNQKYTTIFGLTAHLGTIMPTSSALWLPTNTSKIVYLDGKPIVVGPGNVYRVKRLSEVALPVRR